MRSRLNLTSHCILHNLWSHINRISIKKYFSINWVDIYLFFNIFFNSFYPVKKCGVTSHCLYRHSLTFSRYDGIFIQYASDCNGTRTSNHLVRTITTTYVVLIMSRTRFRVSPHSIGTWMSRICLLETRAMSDV